MSKRNSSCIEMGESGVQTLRPESKKNRVQIRILKRNNANTHYMGIKALKQNSAKRALESQRVSSINHHQATFPSTSYSLYWLHKQQMHSWQVSNSSNLNKEWNIRFVKDLVQNAYSNDSQPHKLKYSIEKKKQNENWFHWRLCHDFFFLSHLTNKK